VSITLALVALKSRVTLVGELILAANKWMAFSETLLPR